jgi:polysaccharide deacetylase 2 family uncharacterized protein YibQ
VAGSGKTGARGKKGGKDKTPYTGERYLAIVMDDCGWNMNLARRVASLDIPLTWAIIPNLRHSRQTAGLLRENGIPFIIHLPMQSIGDKDKDWSAYAVGVGYNENDVRYSVIPILDSLKGAFGVNNHKGSTATEDRKAMDAVMKVLAERKMFFLDSRTTQKSVAYDAARDAGLSAAENSRFLDNKANVKAIAAQMETSVKMALRRKHMIVICHLRPRTVDFLEKFASEIDPETHKLRKSGIKLITLPELAELMKEDK